MVGPEVLGLLLLFYWVSGNSIIGIIFARTMGRAAENRADNFAVKYGYGKAMASALKKLDKWIKKMLAKQECGKICMLGRRIGAAIDEHPPMKERIERVLKAKDTYTKTKGKSFLGIQQYFMKAMGVKVT